MTNGVRDRSPLRLTNNNEGASVNTPSLTIRSTEMNDVGSYVCSAENAAGVGYSGETSVVVSGGKCRNKSESIEYFHMRVGNIKKSI